MDLGTQRSLLERLSAASQEGDWELFYAKYAAVILSFAMCLRHSLGRPAEADLIETAARQVLDGGLRTADIMQPGMARVSTRVMGEQIVRTLDKLAA